VSIKVTSQISKSLGPFSLDEICRKIGAKLSDSRKGSNQIKGIASLQTATKEQVSFLENRKYYKYFCNTQANAVIVHPSLQKGAPKGVTLLLSDNPHKAFALVSRMFHPLEEALNPGVDSAAWLHQDCLIGKGSEIQSGAKICEGAKIGKNCLVGANTVIGKDVTIGDACYIKSNVTISHCDMGDGVSVFPGARIGQAGFGFSMEASGHTQIPQIGKVVIGNNVRIGANTTIDRGALNDTIIGDGCMIDNLVQIGHNVQLGRYCVLAGQAGVAGSAILGDFVVVGGQSAIAGHLNLGDGVTVAGKSGVTRDLRGPGIFGGIPAVPIQQWRRQAGMLSNLVKRRLKGGGHE
tara:strand:- start:1250 stop:2299 length:1050 start_codon:yes stop_codon:yes gene_type:complete